ncbi:MAG: hypothetical protein Kow006_15230 [Gammaproteobacteria bacterium]
MDISELLAKDSPHRSEIHYVRLGRLLIINAVVFLLIFAGTSIALLWRIQNQAEQRAQATALGMVDTAWQWLVDQIDFALSLDPQALARDPAAGDWLNRWLGEERSWFAIHVVESTGRTVARFGAAFESPRLDLPADHTRLQGLPPISLANKSNWLAPIVFPAQATGPRLVGYLNFRAFRALAERIHSGEPGSLSLLSDAGIMLLRHPFGDRLMGRSFADGPLFSERLKSSTRGASWAPKSTDGILRLVAYRKLNGYPFVMTTGIEADAILNRARNEIITAGVLLLAVLLFTVLVVSLLIRQFHLAEGSRHALLEAESRLRELATHDSLTGCLNRRAILAEADEELRRYRRHNRPLSLLMVDIDDFKQINDRHGHLVGDSILVGVASLCRDLLRPTDRIGRYGGEEFLILLPETDEPTATKVAERLRRAVAELPFETGQEPTRITLSIGVAAALPDTLTLKPLIQNADAALYLAKERGRNRVCTSEGCDQRAG